ncbi:hypothetical protein [Prochlorococcus marinus]|nr:hypothetical protein [Prochlorococcus marinus]
MVDKTQQQAIRLSPRQLLLARKSPSLVAALSPVLMAALSDYTVSDSS